MAKTAKSLGRLELLQWMNELVEADYAKIEACSDGVAFCQVLDAISPSSQVPLHKLRFTARNKDDNARNLQIFSSYAKRLKMPYVANVNDLANGRFQHNIECVQFLYDHTMRVAPKASVYYNGFERRMEAYKKQMGYSQEQDLRHVKIQMSSHLIPNKANCRKGGSPSGTGPREAPASEILNPQSAKQDQQNDYQQPQQLIPSQMLQQPNYQQQQQQQSYVSIETQIMSDPQHLTPLSMINSQQQRPEMQSQIFQGGNEQLQRIQASMNYGGAPKNQSMVLSQYSNQNSNDQVNQSRKVQLEDLVQTLENELTQKLFQHKTFLEEIQSVEEERNFYYQKLRAIEQEAQVALEQSRLENQSAQAAQYLTSMLQSTPADFMTKEQLTRQHNQQKLMYGKPSNNYQ